jgi:hypothetical protein
MADKKFFIVRLTDTEFAGETYLIGTTVRGCDPKLSVGDDWFDPGSWCWSNCEDCVELCERFFSVLFPKIELAEGEWCEVDLSCLAELEIIEE